MSPGRKIEVEDTGKTVLAMVMTRPVVVNENITIWSAEPHQIIEVVIRRFSPNQQFVQITATCINQWVARDQIVILDEILVPNKDEDIRRILEQSEW